MNKIAKKIFGVALAAMMAVTTLSPMAVQAADEPQIEAPKTVYLSSSKGTENAFIQVFNLKESQMVKKSSVKSSNSKVAKLNYLDTSISKYSGKTEYFQSGMEDSSYNNSYNSNYIGLELLKAGKSTISFKIGSKSYSTDITVKKYTNPLRSVQISGISSGKNIASKLKKRSDANLTLKKSAKNAVIKLKAKSGWKISNVSLARNKKVTYGDSYSYYDRVDSYNYASSKGASSVSLRVGTLKGKQPYTVEVRMKNTKDGGSMDCYYFINH